MTSKVLLAFYQVAHRIATCKKPYSIAEELILPAAIVEGAVEKLKWVPISNDIMCHQIGDMTEYIHDQLVDLMKQQEFGLQLNEADGSRDAHLVCSVHFVEFSEQRIVEELLFCKPIKLGCQKFNLFYIMDNFISTNNLDWEMCISICTDGTKAISGSSCGLQGLI